MAKVPIKDSVQAIGLDSDELPAKPAPPVVANRSYPCVADPDERAPAGIRRWRLRLLDGTTAAGYVLARTEGEARAEYLRSLGHDPGRGGDLSVVPLPD